MGFLGNLNECISGYFGQIDSNCKINVEIDKIAQFAQDIFYICFDHHNYL